MYVRIFSATFDESALSVCRLDRKCENDLSLSLHYDTSHI